MRVIYPSNRQRRSSRPHLRHNDIAPRRQQRRRLRHPHNPQQPLRLRRPRRPRHPVQLIRPEVPHRHAQPLRQQPYRRLIPLQLRRSDAPNAPHRKPLRRECPPQQPFNLSQLYAPPAPNPHHKTTRPVNDQRIRRIGRFRISRRDLVGHIHAVAYQQHIRELRQLSLLTHRPSHWTAAACQHPTNRAHPHPGTPPPARRSPQPRSPA